MARARLAFSAPRWAGIEQFMQQLCWKYDINIHSMTKSGLISIYYCYILVGEEENLSNALKTFQKTMDQYNRD